MADGTTPGDLGIDVQTATDSALFRWFLASMLLGRPVNGTIATRTYQALLAHDLDEPTAFGRMTHAQLRAVLDEGGYGRFDNRMADELQATMRELQTRSIGIRVHSAASKAELCRDLEQLRGVGPVTCEIFTRYLPRLAFAA